MLLSGYAVELAIKSTEYKAVDDTKVKGQFVTYQTLCAGLSWVHGNTTNILCFVDSLVNAEDDNTDEVQGFVFGTLKWVAEVEHVILPKILFLYCTF